MVQVALVIFFVGGRVAQQQGVDVDVDVGMLGSTSRHDTCDIRNSSHLSGHPPSPKKVKCSLSSKTNQREDL